MAPNDDDESTVTGPVTGAGGASEFAPSSSMSVHTLPEGTRLRDYKITGLIGEGGFGIVYLAFDVSLQRRVAIKEYLPASMASRANASNAVIVKSERHQETFALGLKSFLNEARLLARFDHPSLVKVYRFWEENNTAYMVMPYYEGPTLKRTLADLAQPPDEATLRAWLRPLLDALAVMHTAHCFHRDIAPDNILLTASGPLLLDFGAARRVIGDMTHALTVVLKPGFAPIEQYGESASMTQGAWTDLYALASVVYAAVTGHAPMSSVERLMDDRLQLLSERAAGRYSEPFLAAIDAALSLRPADRPQTVAAFRALLDGRAAQAAPSVGFASTFGAPFDPAPAEPVRTQMPWSAPQATGGEPDITLYFDALASRPPPPRKRRTALVALVGSVSLLGLAAAGYYFGGERSATPVAGASPAPAASPAASAPPVQVGPAPAPEPMALPAPAPPPAAAVLTPAPEPAPMLAPPPRQVTTAPAPAPQAKPVPAAAPATASMNAEPQARPRREPRSPEPRTVEPATRPETERAAPTNTAVTRAKCSDILQKASLEPLTASEANFLKKECR